MLRNYKVRPHIHAVYDYQINGKRNHLKFLQDIFHIAASDCVDACMYKSIMPLCYLSSNLPFQYLFSILRINLFFN